MRRVGAVTKGVIQELYVEEGAHNVVNQKPISKTGAQGGSGLMKWIEQDVTSDFLMMLSTLDRSRSTHAMC